MIIKPGNRVKLVRIEGGNAVVSPGEGVFRGLVPVSKTDLFEQLAVSPPAAPAVPTPPPVAVVPAPVTPPTADLPEPATLEPPPAPEPAPVEAGTTDVVKAMQDSVKAAQIKEFTFEQVLEWKAEADEAVDGETYQIGLASYKAETIFGVKMIQAKALLKGGKVQRWIWPKSGMEIK